MENQLEEQQPNNIEEVIPTVQEQWGILPLWEKVLCVMTAIIIYSYIVLLFCQIPAK